MPPKKQIFQFKILLGEIEPYIWRSIVPSEVKFGEPKERYKVRYDE